jgi:hypothetical protein
VMVGRFYPDGRTGAHPPGCGLVAPKSMILFMENPL